MRIDAYNQIGQVYKINNKLKTQKTSGATRSDHVEISEFGKVLQTAKQAVKNSRDIREDKVADIKARIDNGTYEVSGESFADKVIENYQEFGRI